MASRSTPCDLARPEIFIWPERIADLRRDADAAADDVGDARDVGAAAADQNLVRLLAAAAGGEEELQRAADLLRHVVDESVEHFGLIVARQAAFLLGAARVLHAEAVGAHDFLGELLPAEREIARVDDFEVLEHAECRRARAEVDDGDELVGAGVRHLMGQQLARVLDGECLDVDDPRLQPGRLDGDLALLDVLGARRDEQHVDHVGIALAVADDLEVEADFLHRERNVLVCLQLDLAFEIRRAQILRHLDHFRDRGVAADRDRRFAGLRAGAFVRAANRFADGIGVDDGFFVDGVRRRRLGCVGLDPIPATALDELDELHRGGRDIKADQRSFPTRGEHSFSFPTREVGLESYTCLQLRNLTISHSRYTPL